MTVCVDDAAVPYRGKPRYHLIADSVQELHAFAQCVGIKRCWFHRGARWAHYDVTAEERARVLAAGALALTSRELVRRASAARVAERARDTGQGDVSNETVRECVARGHSASGPTESPRAARRVLARAPRAHETDCALRKSSDPP